MNCRCEYHTTGVWPSRGVVDLWSASRVLEHLRRGWLVPHDWRAILEDAGVGEPVGQMSLEVR